MAWCDVVEPRTLRECRIALGQSQAAFAAMLGSSPESYRTWDAGRRATPLKILARARALATHRDITIVDEGSHAASGTGAPTAGRLNTRGHHPSFGVTKRGDR